MKSGYLKFFVKLFLLIFILIAIDLISVPLFDFVLKNLPDGRFFKLKYALERTNEDVLIIGSSKAESNFVPQILKERLNLTCFNAGRGGQSIPYCYAIAAAVFKRYSPKYVILNIDPYMLEGDIDYDRLSILHPFFRRHKEIQSILVQKNCFESIKLHSNLYAYNSSLFYFFRPFIMSNKDGSPSEMGWKPLLRKMRAEEVISPRLSDTVLCVGENHFNRLNRKKKEIFLAINNLCFKHNTKLILIICPEYAYRNYKTSTINFLEDYSFQNNIPLIDYSRNLCFVQKPAFFADALHLNNDGAKQFSIFISNEIISLQKVFCSGNNGEKN